jgi:hypothetical protein
MKTNRSTSFFAAAAVALAGLGLAGAARADNVYWSVGGSSPGVQLGVANAPPVVLMPQPVYVQAPPVYMQAPPVYLAPRPVVYVQSAPVFMAPTRYIQAGWQRPGYGPGHGRGWQHERSHHEHGDFEEERFGRGHEKHWRD